MMADGDAPQLSNIRKILGWLIGRTVVDVTAGDPPEFPDADDEDAHDIVLHFDNGGTLRMMLGTDEFAYSNPDEPTDDEADQ